MIWRVSAMDDYLDQLQPGQKVALQRLRAVVGGLAPDAEEGRSYGVPAFIYAGRPLLGGLLERERDCGEATLDATRVTRSTLRRWSRRSSRPGGAPSPTIRQR